MFTWPFGNKKKSETEDIKIKPLYDIFNPLKSRIGDFIELKLLEGDQTYTISKIREYEREISGEILLFCDYIIEDEKDTYILRVYPKESSKNVKTIQDCDLLLLNKIYEDQFEEEIADGVKCKEFYRTLEDGTKITYYPLNSGKNGFITTVTEISNDETELKYELTYWDFFRKQESAEDINLFVEINNDNGYTIILEGSLISPSEITVFNH